MRVEAKTGCARSACLGSTHLQAVSDMALLQEELHPAAVPFQRNSHCLCSLTLLPGTTWNLPASTVGPVWLEQQIGQSLLRGRSFKVSRSKTGRWPENLQILTKPELASCAHRGAHRGELWHYLTWPSLPSEHKGSPNRPACQH